MNMRTHIVRSLLAGALAFLMLLTCGCMPAFSTGGAIAEPDYPEMAPYPNEAEYINDFTGEFDSDGFSEVYDAWREDQRARWNQPEGYADGLSPFFSRSIPALLRTDAANPVCSPLNIYMALSMLAETTGGNSRQQILDALGAVSMDALRIQAGQVWNAHYSDDTATTTILANSLWLNNGLHYDSETVDTLAKDYYASVFQGALGSNEMNQALRNWLNEQTGGLLEDQIQNVQMDPQTVLALASTIYYRAKWHSEFSEAKNTASTFQAPGGDVDATFMNKQLSYGPYFWGEDFAAAYLTLEDSSKMWLILPDEGKSPGDILESGLAMDLILGVEEEYEDQKRIKVNLSLPKFDIAADMQLNEALQELGITDVFLQDHADFTALLPEDDAWLEKAQHAARVAIDEEGITAAAYTVMMMAGAAMPPEDEVDFILDRPFLFVIASRDDLPLFAGIVNTP